MDGAWFAIAVVLEVISMAMKEVAETMARTAVATEIAAVAIKWVAEAMEEAAKAMERTAVATEMAAVATEGIAVATGSRKGGFGASGLAWFGVLVALFGISVALVLRNPCHVRRTVACYLTSYQGRRARLVLWVISSVTYPGATLVAQVSNLLYRGFPIRKRHDV